MRSVSVLLCFLAMACAAPAQTQSWENLTTLRAGQPIQIVETGGAKHSGTFVNVSTSTISWREAAGDQTLERQSVHSVKLVRSSRRLRRALLGAAIGAGAGAAIGAGTWESSGFLGGKGAGAAVCAVIGGVGGAVVGALLPTHNTIYQANR